MINPSGKPLRKYCSNRVNLYFNASNNTAFLTDNHKVIKCNPSLIKMISDITIGDKYNVHFYTQDGTGHNYIVIEHKYVPMSEWK